MSISEKKTCKDALPARSWRRMLPGGRGPGGPGPAARGRPERRSGFTLLEVLVALAVLAIILIALHQAFASNIYILSFNRSLWKAILYAHNELLRDERLVPPPVSVREGDFEEGHAMAGYHWKRTVVDDSPLPGVSLRKVELVLSWTEGATIRSYRSEVYVLPK